MSVLIKGMDMPKNCTECRVQFAGFCFVAPRDIDNVVTGDAYIQGRPAWCPPVEIPADHGRLIDGAELVKYIAENAYVIRRGNRVEYGMTCFNIMRAVYAVPTVIEDGV